MLRHLDSQLRRWIKGYVETRRIMDKMSTALYRALNDAGIAIPFPQRDVRLLLDVRVERVGL